LGSAVLFDGGEDTQRVATDQGQQLVVEHLAGHVRQRTTAARAGAPIPQSNPYHQQMTSIDGKIEYDYREFGEFG
jgi:hypothetical protein